jgi:hypothetical protein
MATFGYVDVNGQPILGATDGSHGILIVLAKYPLVESGNVSKITIYMRGFYGSNYTLQLALYDSAFNLLAVTETKTFPSDTVNSWVDFNIVDANGQPSTVALSPSLYWLAYRSSATGNLVHRYNPAPVGTASVAATSYYATFPASLAANYKDYYDRHISVYATYTPTVAPPPSWSLNIVADPAMGNTTPTAGLYVGIPYDAPVLVSASPLAGFDFAGWTLDGVPMGTATSITVEPYTDGLQHELIANFSPIVPKTYTLTIINNGLGTTNPTGTLTNRVDTALVVEVTSGINMSWNLNGTPYTSANSFSILANTMVAGSVNTLTASFATPPTVVLPASASGLINTTIAITATPSGGSGLYMSYDWYVDGVYYTTTTTPLLDYPSGSQSGTASVRVTVTDSQSQTSALSNACVVTISELVSGTFGKTTVGALFAGFGQGPLYVVGTKYTLPVVADVTSIGLRIGTIWGFVSPSHARTAIYDANKNLIAISEEVTFLTAPPESTNPEPTIFPFATPVRLQPGDYYLVYRYDAGPTGTGGRLVTFHDTLADTTDLRTIVDSGSEAPYPSFPSPIIMWYEEYAAEISIFANYGAVAAWNVTISVSPVGSGTTDPTIGSWSVPSGQGLTATATPTGNYVFDHWEFDGVPTTMPIPAQADDTSHTLVAIFTAVITKPTVVLPSSASGLVDTAIAIAASPSGGSGLYTSYDWYVDGTLYATTATPSLGFTSSQAGTFNLTVVVTDTQPQTSNPSNVCVITITAPANPLLTLLVSPSGTGTTSQNPAPPYIIGDQVTISVVIADPANYAFLHWIKEDGSELSASQTASIIMDTNHTYTAVLEQIGHPTLTLSATTGGVLAVTQEPRPPPYNTGDVVAITATPSKGYRLAGWLRDGIPYVDGSGDPLANPITITLDASHTLTAVFELATVEAGFPWWMVAVGTVAVVGGAYALSRK